MPKLSLAARAKLATDEATALREALDILRPAARTASVVMIGVPAAAPELAALKQAMDAVSDLYGKANYFRATRLSA